MNTMYIGFEARPFEENCFYRNETIEEYYKELAESCIEAIKEEMENQSDYDEDEKEEINVARFAEYWECEDEAHIVDENGKLYIDECGESTLSREQENYRYELYTQYITAVKNYFKSENVK